MDSEGSGELVLVPDDDLDPALKGNSNSENEDPHPIVIDDWVCDAPVVPQPLEPPVPQVEMDDGGIGDAVRLCTGSSRASTAVTHSRSTNNAQPAVTERREYWESRHRPINRLNYSVPGGVSSLFAGNTVS